VALGQEDKQQIAIDARKPRSAAMVQKFKSEETQSAYRRCKWLSEPCKG
jgi:hypothetical protein